MSWEAIPPNIRHTAQTTLTPEQLDVLKLAAHGYGYRRIATILNITRDTARNRYHQAINRLNTRLAEEGTTLEQALRETPPN